MTGMFVELCSGIEEDLCRCVITNVCRRPQEVTRQNGGYIDHVLTKKKFMHLRE
jgi:hypothetical protein